MKVWLLSGSQAGQVVDLPRTEAEVAVSTGYGEAAPEAEVRDDEAEVKKGKSKGKSKLEDE